MDWSTVCLFIDYTTADYIIQTTFTTVENINLITMLISTQLTELPPKWLALHIRESSWKYQTYWKMEKLLNPLSREWHLCHVPKPIFCLMLPWPLTSWVLTPNIDHFMPCLINQLHQVASESVHSFSKYPVHKFGTDVRMDGRTIRQANKWTNASLLASLAWHGAWNCTSTVYYTANYQSINHLLLKNVVTINDTRFRKHFVARLCTPTSWQ